MSNNYMKVRHRAMKKPVYTLKQIHRALDFWTKKLNESTESKEQDVEEKDENLGEAEEMMSAAEFFKDSDDIVEADDLPTMEQTVGEADDSFEDIEVKAQTTGYSANTVGAFIDQLKHRCKMTDVLLPRLTPGKKEMMVFDIYSKSGRAVIDFAVGRADDPSAI